LKEKAEEMAGQSESNYKAIHRFIGETDVKGALLRLYQEQADFVIGDPTEMPRHKAPKTGYVGTLSDGQTPGYWRNPSLVDHVFHTNSSGASTMPSWSNRLTSVSPAPGPLFSFELSTSNSFQIHGLPCMSSGNLTFKRKFSLIARYFFNQRYLLGCGLRKWASKNARVRAQASAAASAS
jgi:hypothetical protein